jgi:hypothetical protein
MPNAAAMLDRIRQELPDAVVAIVSNDECCRVGFDALPIPRADLPEQGFVPLGEVQGLAVVADALLVPSDDCRVALGVDGSSGLLMAVVRAGNDGLVAPAERNSQAGS